MTPDKMKFSKTITITKVDEEERMVFGYASTPDMDTDGEIITAEAMKKALPAYMKFPTLREMHQPKVAGVTKQAEATKDGLYIGAKVVANEAWEFVKEGVYKAFSIGGNVLQRVGNVIHEIELVEISLVDSPANKSAVIELWKRDKMTKDAETAYSLANLMIQVKDMISWWDYSGKPTKQLDKILEQIKALLATEAAGDEPAKEDSILISEDAGDIQKLIESLERADFSNNKVAEVLRKGVIVSMTKKLEKIDKKKKDDAVVTPAPTTPVVEAETPATPEVETPVTTTPEGEVTPEAGEPEEGKPVEGEESPEGDTPEGGEAGDEPEGGEGAGGDEPAKSDDPTLVKLAEIEKTLEKLAPANVEEVAKSETLEKAVSSIAKSLDVMAKGMVAMDERLKKVEATPAAVKSKSTLVLKTVTAHDEGAETPSANEAVAKQIEVKEARLAELDKQFEALGPQAFMKAGYSKEAMDLQLALSKLKAQA